MPYIRPDRREGLEQPAGQLGVILRKRIEEEGQSKVGGDINYTIFRILCTAFRLLERDPTEIRYSELEQIRGILGCVWAEIEHRFYVPKETLARKANGDV